MIGSVVLVTCYGKLHILSNMVFSWANSTNSTTEQEGLTDTTGADRRLAEGFRGDTGEMVVLSWLSIRWLLHGPFSHKDAQV